MGIGLWSILFRKYSGSNIIAGEGVERVEFQRKRDGKEDFPGTTHSSKDQQHRTTFYAVKDVRSSYKPALFMDSRFLVDTFWEVSGGVLPGLG